MIVCPTFIVFTFCFLLSAAYFPLPVFYHLYKFVCIILSSLLILLEYVGLLVGLQPKLMLMFNYFFEILFLNVKVLFVFLFVCFLIVHFVFFLQVACGSSLLNHDRNCFGGHTNGIFCGWVWETSFKVWSQKAPFLCASSQYLCLTTAQSRTHNFCHTFHT